MTVLIGGGEVVERNLVSDVAVSIVIYDRGSSYYNLAPEQDCYSLRSKNPFSNEKRAFAPFTIQS